MFFEQANKDKEPVALLQIKPKGKNISVPAGMLQDKTD